MYESRLMVGSIERVKCIPRLVTGRFERLKRAEPKVPAAGRQQRNEEPMGAVLFTVPDIPDAELVLSEDETRAVLKTFWPQRAAEIDTLPIASGARRLAQTALIAAIDASYAMGYIEAVFRSYMHPASSVQGAIRKVAKATAKHYWKHAKGKDMTDAKVYDAVVKRVALTLRSRMDDLAAGLVVQRFAFSFHA